MATAATQIVSRGPYDALVSALRADAAVSGVALSAKGSALTISFATGVTLDISPLCDRHETSLKALHSRTRGQGHAAAAMRVVLGHARRVGTPVRIEVRPFGNVGLNRKALQAFYARLGFVADDAYTMTFPS